MNFHDAMKLLLSNRPLFMETLMEVEDKERRLVPLKPNPIQSNILSTRTGRDIYVKPGQVGATTIFIADYLIDNLTSNGTVSVVISYDEWVAQRQLLKARKLYQALRTRIPTLPILGHKSVYELTFENKDTNFYSAMYIYSSQSYTIGRGEAIHNLLMDEYAFWKPGSHEEIFASAVQRVPLKLGTKVAILSTANGQDNPFCEMFEAAKEGKAIGKSVYQPHFYPWYLHPEYHMMSDDPFVLPGDDSITLQNITQDEQNLMLKMGRYLKDWNYPVDEQELEAKVRWKRYKVAEMMSMSRTGESSLIFEQEFPEDDESCFITSGDSAYNSDIVSNKLRECYPPIKRMPLVGTKGLNATVDIWYDKQPGESYIIGIDPGKGKTSESVASVWTFKEAYKDSRGIDVPAEFRHCATLAGYYDEYEMADLSMSLGRYYNDAVLAPEDNLDIVSHLRDYPELYWREDLRDGRTLRAVGWQTNSATKPFMITEVSRHLDELICHDQRFWSQLRNLRRDRTVKTGIVVVGMDDHHDASAIAIVCRNALPVVRGLVGTYGWGDNW